MTREVRMRMPAPPLSFLLSHPAHFIALGGGAGLAPIAPGTVGTLVAFPIAWLLDAYAGTALFLVVIAAVAAIGVVTMERGLVVTDEHGAPLARLPRAFDHFA